jgi:phage gp46-like protein
MTQIKIRQEGVDLYDLALNEDDGDHLVLDESLVTAVLISLLTERRCDPSEAPDPSDLGGWFGDSYPAEPGDALGSRLWTLLGAPMVPATLVRAEGYVREALEWMVTDGVLTSQNDIAAELAFQGHALVGKCTFTHPASAVPAWEVAWTVSLR